MQICQKKYASPPIKHLFCCAVSRCVWKYSQWILSVFMHFYEGVHDFWMVFAPLSTLLIVLGPFLALFWPFICLFLGLFRRKNRRRKNRILAKNRKNGNFSRKNRFFFRKSILYSKNEKKYMHFLPQNQEKWFLAKDKNKFDFFRFFFDFWAKIDFFSALHWFF